MKFIRVLSRHGNSIHVSLPPQVIDYLRWRPSDGILVEVTSDDRICLRRATPGDLLTARMTPLTLDLTAPGAK